MIKTFSQWDWQIPYSLTSMQTYTVQNHHVIVVITTASWLMLHIGQLWNYLSHHKHEGYDVYQRNGILGAWQDISMKEWVLKFACNCVRKLTSPGPPIPPICFGIMAFLHSLICVKRLTKGVVFSYILGQ